MASPKFEGMACDVHNQELISTEFSMSANWDKKSSSSAKGVSRSDRPMGGSFGASESALG
ncbi:uncharacterized protein N7511_002321 [Penicillium nucicola]|uniref:uncharacterized protein n=1 Tax=Penicillium nucicola TaxID=1850975 RepID=UPI00254527A8|nr:uncharacterized protein N7511_002321 [Penicillium nucicola]KAJ5770270.1 hypothetical protein N7511_002321 [Penicillium nucicola]